MEQALEEKLLQTIKKDDVKAFDALTEDNGLCSYRLGRFPLLSLMYLYRSRKLLSAYEVRLLQITAFDELREPVEISKKFSAKAGKCLRLYLNGETVSPYEMLLILDKTKRLKQIYPLTAPSAAVRSRLKSIYFIKYSLNVKFVGDGIVIDKRPLSYREKKRIATVCLSVLLTIAIVVGVPVTTVSLMPKPVEGEVVTLGDIDFGSDKEYTLKQDLVLPDNYTVEKVSCKINGEGRKLVLGKGATLGELGGEISNMTIESSGEAIFSSVLEKATVKNVTVNVNAAVSSSDASAFVALTNYGTIENVTLNVSGSINALAKTAEATEELAFGGIVQNNSYKYYAATQTAYNGTIKSCKVIYSQFSLVGEASANASFGGIAGINGAYLQDCSVSGVITSDTFDIAGICSTNNGVLSGNVNEARLVQTSSDTGWNPIVCGIVLTNAYAVENCENRGNISSTSSCGSFEVEEGYETTASAAGIAYINRSSSGDAYILNCVNSGNIDCSAEHRSVYAAGICLSSSGGIESCKNSGDIAVRANNGGGTYVGGIAAVAYGSIYKSVNEGEVSVTGDGTAQVGGIAARLCAQISNCLSSGAINVTAKNISAGGIFGFGEVTNLGIYVYFGSANFCISECAMRVTAVGEEAAYVGGIAGYVREIGISVNSSVAYFGGCVTNSYFMGTCLSDITYFGSIVGVCGANIYESNSYFSGNTEYHNFENNRYLSGDTAAFGAALNVDGDYASVADKGATSATIDEIKNSDAYNQILGLLQN